MVISSKPVLSAYAVVLAVLAIWATAIAAEPVAPPPDYTAVYKVLRNDRELAAVTIELSHSQDVWKLHGFSHDTRGLAKFLNIKGSQTTVGTWLDGRFRPDSYSYAFSLIGVKQNWRAIFDWQTNTLELQDKKHKTRLPLDGFIDDPFSLSLNLMILLITEQPEITARIVDEDKIETHIYTTEPRVKIETPLGCLATTLVTRMRENKKRVSLAWHAQNHHFVPVKMLHKNKKGTRLELLITALEIDGKPLIPTTACDDQPESGKSVRNPSA